MITQTHDTCTTFLKKILMSQSSKVYSSWQNVIVEYFFICLYRTEQIQTHYWGRMQLRGKFQTKFLLITTAWVSVCHHFQSQTNCFIMALKNSLAMGHSESCWRVSKYSPSPFLSTNNILLLTTYFCAQFFLCGTHL